MQWIKALFVFLISFGAFLGASFLAAVWRRRRLDPDSSRLERILPGYDCGVCGHLDCRDYAVALLNDGADPALCLPGGSATAASLRSVLAEGRDETARALKRAVVRCTGTSVAARVSYAYSGYDDCASAAALYGGPKDCKDGCLGFGSCVRACPLGAIRIEKSCATVDPRVCTGCGLCLSSCPKALIVLIPVDQQWFVACSAKKPPEERLKDCDTACTACGECARRSVQGEFVLDQGMARASAVWSQSWEDIARACPTGAIRRVDDIKKT
ncbi:MAG TPA: (Fe-S)-binding protein [Rectinemataceae bacterium]|nr:(Fe-S)-binding protein [Rectinemataceae bacterium]